MVGWLGCTEEPNADDPVLLLPIDMEGGQDSSDEPDVSVIREDMTTTPDMVEDEESPVPVIPTELREIEGRPFQWVDGLTCSMFCESEGLPCNNIEGEHAGGANYSWTNKSDTFTQFKRPKFMTCEELIPQVWDEFGTTYEMDDFYCRCTAPLITITEAPIHPVITCDEVCAMSGQVCEPETSWGLNLDGGMASYQGESARRHTTHDCGAVPPGTLTRSGREYTLFQYQCGCVVSPQ